MPTYDVARFDPPAPLAQVTLRNLDTGAVRSDVLMLIDQEWGILGRNVLNAIPLLFDGPHLIWDVHHSSS